METQALQSGSTLQGGKYVIREILGKGGFGITYLGSHLFLNRDVAIKEFFMGDFCERDGNGTGVAVSTKSNSELVGRFREKFVKEAQLIASFNNPHIIRIYDIFEENGTAYYVMECLGHGSLKELVYSSGRLGADKATALILQVADALSYIHERKVLHLDVKPSNILLDDSGNAVLIDFGISKRYDTEGEQTSSSPVGRSRGFAPIEQYKAGGVEMFTPATDIYSLGATLYYLVTGSVPPEASDVVDDGLGPKPEYLAEYIWTAITKSMSGRRQRPQNVSDFVELFKINAVAAPQKEPEATEEMPIHQDDETETTVVETNEQYSNSKDRMFRAGDVAFTMRFVEGGTSWMGAHSKKTGGLFDRHPDMSIPNYDEDASDDERPVHSVTLDSYFIGETEVTQALWQAVMGSNPSYWKGDNLPVERVSWDDCQTFIRKLNSLTGQNFRLPTEAEWEYAARGGNRSNHTKYSGSSSIGKVAWYTDNSGSKTHAVKGKQPNELGLYDMSGNVWEWCQDWYGGYSSSSQTNPAGPASGSRRVSRGGSWAGDARRCRVSDRDYYSPDCRLDTLGLRLAL